MLSQFTNSKFLITADIDDFYPTIYPAKVMNTLIGLNFDDSAAKLITRLTTFDSELPQGFPTSPKIAALALNTVIIRLAGLSKKETFRIGLYADNLVIGSNYSPERFQKIIVKIFRQNGFLLDEFQVYNKGSIREAMGIRINSKLEVVQSYIDTVKEEIIAFKNNPDQIHSFKSIKGKIDYIENVNPQQAISLRKMIKS
jgi:hypothetical protein